MYMTEKVCGLCYLSLPENANSSVQSFSHVRFFYAYSRKTIFHFFTFITDTQDTTEKLNAEAKILIHARIRAGTQHSNKDSLKAIFCYQIQTSQPISWVALIISSEV